MCKKLGLNIKDSKESIRKIIKRNISKFEEKQMKQLFFSFYFLFKISLLCRFLTPNLVPIHTFKYIT